jgi:hypothetical protein
MDEIFANDWVDEDECEDDEYPDGDWVTGCDSIASHCESYPYN